MACGIEKDRLSAYLDEELGAKERAEVQTHLDGCEECRGELDAVRSVSGMLRSVGRENAPESLRWDLQKIAPAPKVLSMRRWMEMATAVAAVGLFGLGIFIVSNMSDSAREAPSLARQKRVQRAPRSEAAPAPTPAEMDKLGEEVAPVVQKDDNAGDRDPADEKPAEPEAEPKPPAGPAPVPSDIVVIGDTFDVADRAVNTVLGGFSTEVRRYGDVVEARMSEADARRLMAQLEGRAEIVATDRPYEFKDLARLSSEDYRGAGAGGGRARRDAPAARKAAPAPVMEEAAKEARDYGKQRLEKKSKGQQEGMKQPQAKRENEEAVRWVTVRIRIVQTRQAPAVKQTLESRRARK